MATESPPSHVELALQCADRARRGRGSSTHAGDAELLRTGASAPTTRRLVIGDPQASAEKFFSILDREGVLSESGWLAPGVRLTSMGDHFDYGRFEIREQAAESGVRILSWLAAHSSEQVTVIAGNHDLSRVAELIAFDDEAFQRACVRAAALYGARPIAADAESAFLRDFPMFASVEIAARDLSTFRVEQRELVTALLRRGRFRLAAADEGMLFVHAGATRDDLVRAGAYDEERTSAELAAERLNGVFDEAVHRWDGSTPFAIPGFFEPGSAAAGEPGGFLFQRAVQPNEETGERPKGRRFDPRQLPLGLAQVIGHVRDPKCRLLLGSWVRDEAAEEGALRYLRTDGRDVWYQRGLPSAPPNANEAHLVFTDGGMHHVPVERYELLELPCYPGIGY